MKTRREASSLGCSAFSASRAAATSGRSCSHAWRTFFERDLVAVVEAPHRAHGDAELLLSTKSFADFLQRQIGLLGNEMEQQSSCAWSGDVEQARDLAPALTLLDQCNRARTQVIRVPPRRHISPPLLTEQPESDLRARWNPLWQFRLVSSRKRSRLKTTKEAALRGEQPPPPNMIDMRCTTRKLSAHDAAALGLASKVDDGRFVLHVAINGPIDCALPRVTGLPSQMRAQKTMWGRYPFDSKSE